MKKNNPVLLFSLTKKDFEVDFFMAPGPGGQHRNKVATAARITHPASGAVATATEHKSQSQNREAAFKRLLETKKFKYWHKLETARRLLNYQSIEEMIEKAVDEQMSLTNLKFEIQDKNGRWVECGKELASLTFDELEPYEST